MLHWYLLAQAQVRACPRLTDHRPERLGFEAAGGPSLSAGLSVADRRKMFWLGALETALPAGSVWGGATLAPDAPLWAWFALGAVLMAGACWLLRHQTPQAIIHLTGSERRGNRSGGYNETEPHQTQPN
jgi:hypothetical protein